jgi:hypothetical protein
MTREDSERVNVAFANLEAKAPPTVSSPDVSMPLRIIGDEPVRGSVASRGLVRRKVAQEDLKRTMRRQMARTSAKEATSSKDQDEGWEMVENSMFETDGEQNQSKSRNVWSEGKFEDIGESEREGREKRESQGCALSKANVEEPFIAPRIHTSITRGDAGGSR